MKHPVYTYTQGSYEEYAIAGTLMLRFLFRFWRICYNSPPHIYDWHLSIFPTVATRRKRNRCQICSQMLRTCFPSASVAGCFTAFEGTQRDGTHYTAYWHWWLFTSLRLEDYYGWAVDSRYRAQIFRLFGSLKKEVTEKWFAKDVQVKQAVTSLLTLV